MVERQKNISRLYRLAGFFGLSDYEPTSHMHSKKAIQSLGRDLNYPFSSYTICRGFVNLGVELKDRLATFDTVLSDDAGGRLVSLVMGKLINFQREALNLPPSRVFFLASSVNTKAHAEIEAFLASRRSEIGNALVCTQFVDSGTTIDMLSDIIDRLGIRYTLAILEDGTVFSFQRDKKGHKYKSAHSGVIYVSKLREMTKFMDNPSLTGVYTIKDQLDPFPKKAQSENVSQSVTKTRADLEVFTARLAKAIGIKL